MRSDEGRRFGWLNHERRVFVLSLAAGLPAVVLALVLLRLGDYSHEGHVDVGHARRRVLAHRLARRPRTRRPAAADALEHAGRAPRGRLLAARAQHAVRRRAGARAARGQHPRQHAPGAAARRHGSDGAAAHRHGGDRRRDLRVRCGQPAATGESRRRAVVRRAGRAAARAEPPTR